MKSYRALIPKKDFQDAGIFLSDHDVVVGEALAPNWYDKMLIVTFNCAGLQSPPQGSWKAFLRFIESETSLLNTYAAICICLQESGARNPFAKDLADYLGPTYSVYSESTTSVPFSFSVRCIVALKTSRYRTTEVTKSATCLKMACVKAGVGIVVRSLGAHAPPGFVIVSAHLPFVPKKKDLGFSERVHALQVLEKNFLSANKDLWGIVAGDLNFRVVNGKNELSERLGNFSNLSELSSLKTKTCKLLT